jgi:hypothetical protein
MMQRYMIRDADDENNMDVIDDPHSWQCTFKPFASYNTIFLLLHLFLPQTIPTQIVTKSQIIKMTPALFTLITSDNISIEVDSNFLAKHSTIFADMFILPLNKDQKNECTVSDTSNEVKLMMEALSVESNQQKQYELIEIRTLVQLSDKYSINALALIAECALWFVPFPPGCVHASEWY